jgi:hypothetical protein
MAAEPDGELFSEPDDIVQRRVERAIRADTISLSRAYRNGDDAPAIMLMLGLGENDALMALSLRDARWLADELLNAVKALGG